VRLGSTPFVTPYAGVPISQRGTQINRATGSRFATSTYVTSTQRTVRTFKSEHQTEPNTVTVPILADINFTEDVFQNEESDPSAHLSVLGENLSAMSGGGDAGNSRWPYAVPLQRLVEEAIKHRGHRNERRISQG